MEAVSLEAFYSALIRGESIGRGQRYVLLEESVKRHIISTSVPVEGWGRLIETHLRSVRLLQALVQTPPWN